MWPARAPSSPRTGPPICAPSASPDVAPDNRPQIDIPLPPFEADRAWLFAILRKLEACTWHASLVLLSERFRLTTTALDMRHWLVFQQRYWVIRMLKVRLQVGRGPAGESLDIRVFHERFVKIDQDGVEQRQGPT